jgi:hypothetical protein
MKIFCIGFQKTGTTTLGKALSILGYEVCSGGPKSVINSDPSKVLLKTKNLVNQYDAFEDVPCLNLPDSRLPISRFQGYFYLPK